MREILEGLAQYLHDCVEQARKPSKFEIIRTIKCAVGKLEEPQVDWKEEEKS